MRTLAMSGLAVWVAIMAAGCTGRIFGEGAEAAFGPKGKYWQEKPLGAFAGDKPLAAYTHFKLGTVSNAYGRNVPESFFDEFTREFDKELARAKHLPKNPSGKTLVVNAAVLHYEKADLTDNIFGPHEEVVARVEMLDQSSGKVLGIGNAVGRTTKTVGLGVQNKAEGLAKGIVKWITDYYPKPAKEGREERE